MQSMAPSVLITRIEAIKRGLSYFWEPIEFPSQNYRIDVQVHVTDGLATENDYDGMVDQVWAILKGYA